MWNKIILHVFAALFSGFTFWKMGDGTFALQLRLFAIFNFIFVAPGCINQMQPFFLHNRDIFETREKKASSLSSTIRTLANRSSLKPTTGSHSSAPKPFRKSPTSLSAPRSTSHAGTLLPDCPLMRTSPATCTCR